MRRLLPFLLAPALLGACVGDSEAAPRVQHPRNTPTELALLCYHEGVSRG